MDVHFIEMRQVLGEHLDQSESYGGIVGQGDPESAVRLRLEEVTLARDFVQDGRRSMAVKERGRRQLDRGERVNVSRASGRDRVAGVHGDSTS